MNEYSINVCHLYPDAMIGTGDLGNLICIKKRLEWRGIKCNIENILIGDTLSFDKYDIIFIGGGEDFNIDELVNDAITNKKDALVKAIENDTIILAICGGLQMLGSSYTSLNGNTYNLLNCLNLTTKETKNRMSGNLSFSISNNDGNNTLALKNPIYGFENHIRKTYLGESIAPLGAVLSGYGNNGEDKTEGCRYKNVFASYCGGAILPNNPVFCDMLLTLALSKKYNKPDFKLSELK